MKVQKLNEYNKNDETYVIQEGISDIFKPATYKEKVFSSLLHLMMDEQSISEKDFKRIDVLMEKLREFFKDNRVNNVINEFEEEERRNSYCAEFIYDAIIKNSEF
jgi:predicted metalloendopeptidase